MEQQAPSTRTSSVEFFLLRSTQRRIKSRAPLCLRGGQDCDELKAARPELLAEDSDAPGTYLRVYKTKDSLGIGPNVLGFYGGVAWGQSVADRNAEHDRVDREIEEAEARGDTDAARAPKDQQGTLYHGDVIGVWAWGMSTFPPGTEEERADWLETELKCVGPQYDTLRLRQLGAHHCERDEDRAQYMIRQVPAFDEHHICATVNTVVGGYDGMDVYGGALFNQRDFKPVAQPSNKGSLRGGRWRLASDGGAPKA